jgi:hypothetical protein
MRTLLAVILVLAPGIATAQTQEASYTGTHHGRVLACYAQAYTIVELVDIANRNLLMVVAEAGKDTTSERQQIVSGMLASGTLNDQQQALDVAERLDACVEGAIEQASPDAAAAFAAGALREEIGVALTMADGFGVDYRQSAAALTQFLAAGGDAELLSATVRTYSGFGDAVRSRLVKVRTRTDDLIARSKAP